MKKASLLLIVIALLFGSCKKTQENEWSRFFNFTQADILGHYEANPDESLYQELPTSGIAVYANATMDVTAPSATTITIHIVIPGHINKTFSGLLSTNSDIMLHNDEATEDISMTVYTNSKNQVRFHGRVKPTYGTEVWGFDVIKQE